ncbi:uncharacterized protein EV154DRAFT_517111 [Mucor mucedo]|uniref:uncharacterized protein n=1 Tax=Mucor mucedo TaxID=29922 RepID=UPI0022204199|nr:uncharacterized protein EV154DRAFT_517111 [Mucor mucedo]KAI7888578.1 hypothetical protein EV154DRAFT_517111 [Mucor mucedo]
MRLRRQPFAKFDASTNPFLWNSKDVSMLMICILSVSITTYSFHTVLFYYYFEKNVVPADYVPDAFIFLHTLIVVYVANAITRKYTSENKDQRKASRKIYVYVGLITSIVAFVVRLAVLGFIADPEKHGDDFQYLYFSNFMFLLEISLWLLSLEFDIEVTREGKKIIVQNHSNDVIIGADH